MDTVSALYLRRLHPGSLLLRTLAWSSWSHVATIIPGGNVIDATFPHGVRKRSLQEVKDSASESSLRTWRVPSAALGYAWLEKQIGQPYDTLGVLGIGLHRDWQSDDAWFCSELHEMFLMECGLVRFFDKPRRVTQQLSWMVK